MRPLAIALVLVSAAFAPAVAATEDTAELAKKLSNPISDLVSLPVQFNWEFGEGPDEDTWEITNIQPVVPFHLSQSTNMIARLIMPTINRPGTTLDGDMTFSLFFSPARSSGVTWGAGPAMILPRTGEKWGLGPTFVILKQTGNLTYGALANQIWSFAGDDQAPDVSQLFLQPFFAVQASKTVTFTIQSETQANWQASSGNEWTIPLNVLVSKLVKHGPVPISYTGGAGVYLDSPDGGPEWKLRGAITMLFPVK
ncbi:MAG TPA: hypothetical protein VKF80_06725 [Candidatus Eisenbacteria bacterium]|nr:hypothetical protein [Candidatus Eisenbacteria bacterium]